MLQLAPLAKVVPQFPVPAARANIVCPLIVGTVMVRARVPPVPFVTVRVCVGDVVTGELTPMFPKSRLAGVTMIIAAPVPVRVTGEPVIVLRLVKLRVSVPVLAPDSVVVGENRMPIVQLVFGSRVAVAPVAQVPPAVPAGCENGAARPPKARPVNV